MLQNAIHVFFINLQAQEMAACSALGHGSTPAATYTPPFDMRKGGFRPMETVAQPTTFAAQAAFPSGLAVTNLYMSAPTNPATGPVAPPTRVMGTGVGNLTGTSEWGLATVNPVSGRPDAGTLLVTQGDPSLNEEILGITAVNQSGSVLSTVQTGGLGLVRFVCPALQPTGVVMVCGGGGPNAGSLLVIGVRIVAGVGADAVLVTAAGAPSPGAADFDVNFFVVRAQ